MPRHSLVLQVFVASPSDVSEERLILNAVVAELNRTWAGSLGLTFEILKWETHSRPGFDVDPQAVINSQLSEDYDVFIGILWARLGTPTNRAVSGTVEEFERAYSRFKSTGLVPEIMLYFKDAPLSPSKIDATQFAALQVFRTSLSDKGGLFSTFEDQAGFEASVRAHLSAVAQKFASTAAKRDLPVPVSIPADTEAAIEDEEYGLLDYLDIYGARTQDMTAAMNVINEATVRIGEQLSQRSTEMNTHGSRDAAQAKRLVRRASEDMVRYADTLESHVPVLASARQEAFATLSSAVALMADFQTDHEQLESLRTTLHETTEGARTAKSGLLGMRTAVNGLPRMTKELNRSKRAVTSNLDSFLAELDSTESTVANIIEAIDRLLAPTGSNTLPAPE
jgi:hypothetical protein